MSKSRNLVIVGTGCAGSELAFGARAGGWEGSIDLIGDDPALPYHRPPLSKGYLTGESGIDELCLKAASAYDKAEINISTGTSVVGIDRDRMRVYFESGRELPYDKLVLLTGGRPRSLPATEAVGEKPTNVHYLRTLADADAIRQGLAIGGPLVVVGGGYIGLEVAAAAVKLGLHVTVLQAESRVLERVTAPPLSAFYEEIHRRAGVDLRTGEQVERFELSPDGKRVTGVCCKSGTRVAAAVVVVGIGLVPNTELATQAGLETSDGIVVNSHHQTSDSNIFAAGDCARFPSDIYGRHVRIESVPNALEHARRIAAILCGKAPRPQVAPWFWSTQYDLNLKIVGLSQGYDRLVIRGSMPDRSFSAFYLSNSKVIAVDTVNRPIDFNVAKQLVGSSVCISGDSLEDESIPLKNYLG